MDPQTLLASLEYGRARLIGTLETLEKSGQDANKVLSFRPGPGRAHMGWQFMHCAATHDRYYNVRLKGGTETDPVFVTTYGGGSTPSDSNIPSFIDIRARLDANFKPLRDYVAGQKTADLDKEFTFPNNTKRTLAESLLLLAWHEAHHQGQIHLTWNMYKAANGIK